MNPRLAQKLERLEKTIQLALDDPGMSIPSCSLSQK